MKSLTIRNVPDSVYRALAEWARSNHRSMQEQVRHLLEEQVRLREGSVLAEAAAFRARMSARPVGDVLSEVREDRAR